LILLDPDRIEVSELREIISLAEGSSFIKAYLVGTSFLYRGDVDEFIMELKSRSHKPVLIFPGDRYQLSDKADAVLFLSLLSGRNPEYLIGEQVKAAPFVWKYRLEAIPTAYLLIESGHLSSVEFVSNTKPLPRDKEDLFSAYVLASYYLGFKLLYLEAGSGAPRSVPLDFIRKAKELVDLPLLVGGGLKGREDVEEVLSAGADFAVVGDAVEKSFPILESFS